MTPRQRRILGWLYRQWWCPNALYFAVLDRFTAAGRARKAEHDWRIRMNGQSSWIRATRLQYEQALELGIERSIGVPEIVWEPRAVSAAMEDAA